MLRLFTRKLPISIFAIMSGVFLTSGCGKKKADTVNTTNSELVLPERTEVTVFPFENEREYNVEVAVGYKNRQYYFGTIRTVPGVHWDWLLGLPSKIKYSTNSINWTEVELQNGNLLPGSPFILRYKVDFNALSNRGMPGIGGGFGSTSGQTTISSFLFAFASDGDTPIRINFKSHTAPASIAANGTLCGAGCIDFSGLTEAIDTPIYVADSETSKKCLFENGSIPICYTLLSGLEENDQWLSEFLTNSHSKLIEIWNFFVQKWGKVAIDDKYKVHLLGQNGCGYQAMEHATSTLAAIGICTKARFPNNYFNTVIHEMTHVWNGKYLFPRENATWNAQVFNLDRLKQLYFYEGFTEGFARLAILEIYPELQLYLGEEWNKTISDLYYSGLGQSLESLSLEKPMKAYAAGAFLLLKLAAQTRKETGNIVEAKQKIWSLLPTLTSNNESNGFNFSLPIFLQRCATGQLFSVCNGAGSGYTSSSLLATIGTVLNISNWDEFEKKYLREMFLADSSDLKQWVEDISTATGVQIKNPGSSLPAFSTDQNNVSTWPL